MYCIELILCIWFEPRVISGHSYPKVYGSVLLKKTRKGELHTGELKLGFPSGSDGKESACNVGDLNSIPGVGRSPGGGHDNPLQYSCLENPHGQRSLKDYSPWGHKELDVTERTKIGRQVQWSLKESLVFMIETVYGWSNLHVSYGWFVLMYGRNQVNTVKYWQISSN